MYPLVILAGGMAKRLGNISIDIPKCLVPVAGKPFIDWQVDYAAKHGVKDIYICSGWLTNKVEEHFNEYKYKGLNITVVADGKELLGTGGAISNILKILPKSFFVLYGDTYLPIDFKALVDFHKNKINSDNSLLTIYKNNSKLDVSNIIYENNVIIKYSKNKLEQKMKHIDYGLSIMTQEAFTTYKHDRFFDLGDLYEFLVEHKLMYPYLATERFYEIGTPESLAETNQYFLKNFL
ncbi:sugar phosphate nucleotidyltransferase [Gammaproteobacteria bacterium]|nr:sugar phosphate nucleotidyltransferase [Gammaproteobacteria bacterium]